MAKRKLRTIVVNDDTYLWRFNNGNGLFATSGYSDEFRAWLPSQKHDPLVIRFAPDDHYYAGDPLNTGASPIVLSDPSSGNVNLNMPSWAATLIRYALTHGWRPEEAPLTIDGMAILAELDYKPS